MTQQQLQDKVCIGICLHGTFKVTINYRGHIYGCKSNNTSAYDVIRNWCRSELYTIKQAYDTLWDECKTYNQLV